MPRGLRDLTPSNFAEGEPGKKGVESFELLVELREDRLVRHLACLAVPPCDRRQDAGGLQRRTQLGRDRAKRGFLRAHRLAPVVNVDGGGHETAKGPVDPQRNAAVEDPAIGPVPAEQTVFDFVGSCGA